MYCAALIADPALPGKWQPGEEVVYLLVFEGDLLEESTPGSHAQHTLTSRLAEALLISLLEEWAEALWEAALHKEMIGGLIIAGGCLLEYLVSVSETDWVDILSRLIKEQMVKIG